MMVRRRNSSYLSQLAPNVSMPLLHVEPANNARCFSLAERSTPYPRDGVSEIHAPARPRVAGAVPGDYYRLASWRPCPPWSDSGGPWRGDRPHESCGRGLGLLQHAPPAQPTSRNKPPVRWRRPSAGGVPRQPMRAFHPVRRGEYTAGAIASIAFRRPRSGGVWIGNVAAGGGPHQRMTGG